MSDEVKRYDPATDFDHGTVVGVMVERLYGDYVLLSDYGAVEAKRDIAEMQLKSKQCMYDRLEVDRDAIKAAYLEAVDVVEAQTKTIGKLRAELESLKAQEPVAWKYQWVRPSLGISTAVTLDRGEALANCDHGELIPLYASPVVTKIDDALLDSSRKSGFSIDGENQYKSDILDCVVGALAFGAQGKEPPPTTHWLYRFWEIGNAEREEKLSQVRTDNTEALRNALAMIDGLVDEIEVIASRCTDPDTVDAMDELVYQHRNGIGKATTQHLLSQQSERAVVMPEQKSISPFTSIRESYTIAGWNACLDEFARLNPTQQEKKDE